MFTDDALTAAYTVECLLNRAEREGRSTWVDVLPQLVLLLNQLPEARALAYLARAHAAQGNADEALKAAQQALSVDPSVRLAYAPCMMLARFEAARGDWDAVARHCEAALSSCPGDVEASVLVHQAHGAMARAKMSLNTINNTQSVPSGSGPTTPRSGEATEERDSRKMPSRRTSTTATASDSDSSHSSSWREDLDEDQAVEVYSRSAQSWILGTVMQTAAEFVQVGYPVDGNWVEKLLTRNSEYLRPARRRAIRRAVSPSLRRAVSPSLRRSVSPSRRLSVSPGIGEIRGATAGLGNVPNTMQQCCAEDQSCRPGVSDSGAALDASSTPQGRQSPLQPSAEHKDSIDPLRQPKAGSRCSGGQKVLQPVVAIPLDPIEERPSLERPSTEKANSQRPSLEAGRPSVDMLAMKDLHFGAACGVGGNSCVWRGTFRGEDVAIKTLHVADGRLSAARIDEYCKDVANFRAFQHPCIVRFLGIAVEATKFCIVTDFMPNGSLYAWIHEHKKPLVVQKKLSLAIQINSGLQYLHDQMPPCVHRDLKSANVLLDDHLNAKLCDLGMPHPMDASKTTRRVDKGGSLRYSSPELWDSEALITDKIDIWAAGCLLVEVFTGRLPYDDCETVNDIMTRLLIKRQLPFRQYGGMSSALLSLADSCFAFEPMRRIGAARLHAELCQLRDTRALRPLEEQLGEAPPVDSASSFRC